jgi:hypothetical protein
VATLIIDLKDSTANFLNFAYHRSSDVDQNNMWLPHFSANFRISDFVRIAAAFSTVVFQVDKETG